MPHLPDAPLSLHRWAERDRSLAQRLHRASAAPLLVLLLGAVSRLGDGVIWYAAIVLLPWLGGASGTACALRMVLLGLVNLAIYRVVKRHFARRRPFVACEGVKACARC